MLCVPFQTDLVGAVPSHIKKSLIGAVKSVNEDVFFEGSREHPRKNEICEVDDGISEFLSRIWEVERNYRPFEEADFNVDIACPEHKVLIEIEKGTSPRLELDILKVASACLQFPEKWRYAALVVPTTHIKLRLAGRSAPAEYLERLKPVVRPVLEACKVCGFVLIGYEDPRPERR